MVTRLRVEGEEKRATTTVAAKSDAPTDNYRKPARGEVDPCHAAMAHPQRTLATQWPVAWPESDQPGTTGGLSVPHGQMETGQKRGVSDLELYGLAQLCFRDVGDFLEDRFEESNPVTAMFRAHPELRESPAATASLRVCGEVHREAANLHELLELHSGISPIPEYSLRAPKSKWNAVQQGRAAAEKERRRLDLGIAPLPDVANLLGAQGISTVLVEMDDGISGLTLISADGNVLVAANRTHHHTAPPLLVCA